jgi:ACS family hexuronate transporter-like MFS transporter
MSFCACLILPIAAIGYVRSEWAAILLLGIAAGAHQGWSANLFTTASDMFSSESVGSVVGLGGMAGSIGGTLLAFVTGHVLERTHSYVGLFIFASLAYPIALCVMQLLAPGFKNVELAA